MKKIYIFGLGKGAAFVHRCLIKENIRLIGYIDNYKNAAVNEMDGIPIVSQREVGTDYDYIVVTLMKYEETRKQLRELGICAKKIICFFDFRDAENEEYWNILDSFKWRFELLWKHYRSTTMPTLDNLTYELYGDAVSIQSECPKILDANKTAELLWKERKCLARFGDGEFEIMCGRSRAKFQATEDNLGERLREALNAQEDNLLIAIADNYGKLDKYTDEGAEAIRSYMHAGVRKDHMALLDKERQYYDAYLSRPYIIFRDKKGAGERFANVRRIWDNQNVLIVEGEYTRFGVGNDLLDNTAQVSRILAPSENAFSKYDQIVEEVRRYGKNKLILVILGPTATVMAYELAKEGYWIIDIGQLDVEYEWYLRGVEERCDIPYKCVSEVNQYGEIMTDEQESYIKRYQSEIIVKVL